MGHSVEMSPAKRLEGIKATVKNRKELITEEKVLV